MGGAEEAPSVASADPPARCPGWSGLGPCGGSSHGPDCSTCGSSTGVASGLSAADWAARSAASSPCHLQGAAGPAHLRITRAYMYMDIPERPAEIFSKVKSKHPQLITGC